LWFGNIKKVSAKNPSLRKAAKRQAVKKAPKTKKSPFFTLHKAGTVALAPF
jgi:hypothetical protein